MLKIGVIGYGYWGPNLVRNFVEVEGATVEMVADMNADQLTRVNSRYPAIKTTTDINELITSPEIDAVAIATPVSTHFSLAMAALQAGKHVLVEKPMTFSSDEGQQLVDEAAKRNLILMVDHTFVYTGAVRKMHTLVQSGEMGNIYYYDSTRINLGLFQHDVNVIWDLAVHDLSIIEYVLNKAPRAVSATGMSHIVGQPENVAYLTIYYDDNLIAHVNVNWLAPVKVRRTLLGGSKKMIVYDALEPIETIKVYDKGVDVKSTQEIYSTLLGYRTGDMYSPKLDGTEALQREALHFIGCIENGTQPETDGAAGLRVVKILEAATKSMNQRGTVVELD
ncbi:MAG: Gfo/Idh/MocA family oxidoreductase [Anaerolineae bacterium]|nr:Gfo/Idh/MocA family oxidoreductase [Anaerolineae bacterium]MDQ7034719.1 Gfo/Idh/MocA family oxidoreductase [Anaerolineae bacterium]